MRKLILTVLLATSAAMPAMAQDRGFDRQRDRGSHSEAREARAERQAERAQRPERAQRAERAERPQVAERANWSARGAERQRAVEQQAQAGQQAQAEQRRWERRGGDGSTGVTREMRRERWSGTQTQQVLAPVQQRDRYDGDRRDRSNRTILGQIADQTREQRGDTVRRDGSRDGRYQSRYSGSSRQWSNQWRGDRSYDWRHYRDRNRSVFRLGNYYDPYGSRYRRFSIGFSLYPSYYQSSYWLNDPWMYRLPPAYGPYRWVRYYDDALLVNVYTGEVVDVEYDFFW